MIRTQIQLTDSQARKVKRLAASRRISMAEVIRESVDLYISNADEKSLQNKRERALKVVGSFSSGHNKLSENHDALLAKAYE